jgi:hypothetical protein
MFGGRARTTIRSVLLSPPSANLDHGARMQFSAFGDNKGYIWSLNPATGQGTIDQTGLYTAPSSNGTVQVIVTSRQNSTKAASAQVTIRKKDIRPTQSQVNRRPRRGRRGKPTPML